MSSVKPPLSRAILAHRVIPATLASHANLEIPVKLVNHVKNANHGISNQETPLLQLLPR